MLNRTLLFAVLAGMAALEANANPTGAGLLTYPVEPCRIFDTRPSQSPIAHNTGRDVFVRGSVLPPETGAARADCGVPTEAEAVTVNVTVISPTAAGYLQINGTGRAGGVMGPYARITFAALQVISNEIEVSLCNKFNYPAPHEPCLFDENGLFSDFQVIARMTTGATVHAAIDVVGYQARAPLTSAVAGVVNSKEVRANATALLLTTGMRVVCEEPFSSPSNCDFIQPGWTVKAAGHVGEFEGSLAIFAHGAIQEDQN